MEDYGARIRAALAYAKIDDVAAAKALGYSARTLARTLVDREPKVGELKAIADLTEVPLDFLLYGFDADSIIARENRATLARLVELLEPPAKPPAAPIDRRTAEELVEGLHEATRTAEQLLGRLGERIGRRELQSRRAKDHQQGSHPDAASGNS